MKEKKEEIWFPAKKYGYGWGIPVTWQGWAVLIAYVVLLIIGGTTIFRPSINMGFFLVYVVIMSILLILICWKKGEKPEWRWGDKK
jgi:hypothetical protein